jgi:hypothetical protein
VEKLTTPKEITHSVVLGHTRVVRITIAAANITRTDTAMETEPRLYLASDPLSRPYDISFNPNNPNHHSHEYNTIGFDITIANAT